MYTRRQSKKYIPESTGKPCDCKGCKAEGVYRAPKDRTLKNFYWFCLEHVQEYNKNWNFYAGMSSDEIEKQLRMDMVGHRPTWKVNDLYANALKDPLDILGLARGRMGKRQAPPEMDDFESKDAHIKMPNLATVEHLNAIRTLNLTPPITCDTVKCQYKALAKKYHPDKNAGSKEAEEIFKNVTQAYQLLMKALRSGS